MTKNNKQNTPTQPTAPATPIVVKASETVADQIWKEISNKDILMFALPAQKVATYCTPVSIDPSRCFLTHKVGATAVIPALEEAIGPAYTCEVMDKYIVVSRKTSAFPR